MAKPREIVPVEALDTNPLYEKASDVIPSAILSIVKELTPGIVTDGKLVVYQ